MIRRNNMCTFVVYLLLLQTLRTLHWLTTVAVTGKGPLPADNEAQEVAADDGDGRVM